MFADVGYANLFQRAGLFSHNASRFSGVVRRRRASFRRPQSLLFAHKPIARPSLNLIQATVSGASWFSTQLFYSRAFYNRTVMAGTSEELEAFVELWMDAYWTISTDVVRE